MSEDKSKHPSLEAIAKAVPTIPSSDFTETIASLEKQHQQNLEEKARLEELNVLLDQDEGDLAELRKEIFRKILARMGK